MNAKLAKILDDDMILSFDEQIDAALKEDAEVLSDKHAKVLAQLVYLEGVLTNPRNAHVEASTNPHDGFPFPTLAAMARRGLVELRWYQEDCLHVRSRRYRAAIITEAGRAAHERHINS